MEDDNFYKVLIKWKDIVIVIECYCIVLLLWCVMCDDMIVVWREALLFFVLFLCLLAICQSVSQSWWSPNLTKKYDSAITASTFCTHVDCGWIIGTSCSTMATYKYSNNNAMRQKEKMKKKKSKKKNRNNFKIKHHHHHHHHSQFISFWFIYSFIFIHIYSYLFIFILESFLQQQQKFTTYT